MTVTVRKAEPKDANTLAHIGAKLFEQTFAGPIPEDAIATYIEESFGEKQQQQELTDPDIVSLLVESDGTTIGFAQVRKMEIPVHSEDPADVQLWRIYLDRQYHGSGIAQSVMKELGLLARQMNATGIWLTVWEQNTRAFAFYRKFGFNPVGVQEFRTGDDVQMDTVLRAPPDAF